MTADEARAALTTLAPVGPGSLGELAVTRPGGLRVSVGFGVAGPSAHRVNAVELFPADEPGDVVRFRGVDVFGAPAEQVLAELRRHARFDEDEENGSVIAPDLLLVLAPGDEDEPFESVLLARPGYYDTPAQAAARLAAAAEPGY
jgi:hypothetical protein